MVMAFTIDVPGATVFAVAIPVLLAVVFAIILVTIPMYRKVQNRLDGVTAATRENLTGVRVLRAFRKEQEEIAEFSRRNRLLNQLQLRVGRISNLLNPVTYVILNLAVVALLRTGALRVNSGALTQGQVVALYNYMSQILVELIKFANLIITMTKAVACGKPDSKRLCHAIQPDFRQPSPGGDAAGTGGVPQCRNHLRRGRCGGPFQRDLSGPSRSDSGDHRRNRLRQIHSGESDPPVFMTPPRARFWWMGWMCGS